MRKLVIGCGYLGYRVASIWKRSGVAVSVLTRSLERALALKDDGFDVVIGDVMDPMTLSAIPTFDSALYAVGFDRSGCYSKREVYVEGLTKALNSLQRKCEKLVFVSSTSVYGQSLGEVVDENSETSPSEENGRICLEAEFVARGFHSSSFEPNGRSIVLRLAGIYGPGRVLARIDQLKNQIPLPGNPDAWLNLIHVDDATTAAVIASDRGQLGETYLVSDNSPVRRVEYYSALAERIYAPKPQFLETASDTRVSTHLNKQCTNRKLREELGVELKYPSFTEGLNSLPEVRQSQGLPLSE